MCWGLGGLEKICTCIFEICQCNEICRLDTISESKSKHLYSSKKFVLSIIVYEVMRLPNTGIVKYHVKLKFEVDGLVEKADIIGAIFGQTEGLLGPEMNLNELQKVSKVGRIEVNVDSRSNMARGDALQSRSLPRRGNDSGRSRGRARRLRSEASTGYRFTAEQIRLP